MSEEFKVYPVYVDASKKERLTENAILEFDNIGKIASRDIPSILKSISDLLEYRSMVAKGLFRDGSNEESRNNSKSLINLANRKIFDILLLNDLSIDKKLIDKVIEERMELISEYVKDSGLDKP